MIDFHTHPVLIREFVAKYPSYERVARTVFNIGNNFQPLQTLFLQMDVAGCHRFPPGDRFFADIHHGGLAFGIEMG